MKSSAVKVIFDIVKLIFSDLYKLLFILKIVCTFAPPKSQ